MLRNHSHHSSLLQENYDKFGEENIKFHILYRFDTLQEAQAKEAELIYLGEYNISNSAIGGGDNFTRNPRKEKIRKMRVKQMSGKGNHQYGKPKTEKMIQSVKKANSKKIIVDGVLYNSIKEYSKISGVKETTICYRLRSENFKNYQYA